MYFNLCPKEYTFEQLIFIAAELTYLLRKSNVKIGDHTEVFWVYNRAIHDMTAENADDLSTLLLNSII